MNPVVVRRFAVAATCIALACCLAAGYRFSSWLRSSLNRPVVVKPHEVLPPRISVKIHYRGCGHVAEARPPAETAGATLEQVLSEHPGSRVTISGDGGVEVVSEVDGLCPDDAPYRFVCLRGDHVAVYYGRSRLEGNLKEVRLDLPVTRLSSRDAGTLRKGEVVLGDAGVSRLLEGLVD
ncbi:MAG: hypothetical protein NUV93_05145 [Firmicutes bacterium]|nr:hypothetical protein [Bacillota bacterium]